jgi:dienelactone hydrolase
MAKGKKGILIVPVFLLISLFLFSFPIDNVKSFSSTEVASILKIPAVTGHLTIDGNPDDVAWQSAFPVSLQNIEKGIIEEGGEARVAVRGNYLCISARIPASGRLITRSTGIEPRWWSEDLIIWRLRYRSPVTQSNMIAMLVVNPLGAYSLRSVPNIYNTSDDDLHSSVPLDWVSDILVAAEIGRDEWSMEAALPLEKLGAIGLLSVERIRAPRLNTPERRWHWPAQNEKAAYDLAGANTGPPPLFQSPELPQNNTATLEVLPLNDLAVAIQSLPGQAWTKAEQDSLGVREMLRNSIQERMAIHAEDEKNEWQRVKTVSDWEQFRDKRLAALSSSLGPLPERTPLNPAVTRRIDYGEGFVIENIVYESRPGLVVAANLYLPGNYSGKIPAIVVVHSHHAPKIQSELQNMGMTWARSGTAVLVMDQLCAGERIQSQPWSREGYYGRYALGNQLYLAGESLIKWMAWDIIRGIDLLSERDYIDTNRIVLLGAVAGGGEPAALAANLDQRVAAVIPFNFGEAGPEEHYLYGPRLYDFETAYPGWAFWETTRNLPNSVSGQFFPWFICAAVAPRNFIYAFEMGWPGTVEDQPPWSRYKKVFGLYGVPDNVASVEGFGPFPGPGECTNVGAFHRKAIYPILNRWLGMPVPESEYSKTLPGSELMCLTSSLADERNLKSAAEIALDIASQRLSASRASLSGLSAEDRSVKLRMDLKDKLGDIDPNKNVVSAELWSRQYSGFTMEAFSIETDPGIIMPVFVLKPINSSQNGPAVIGLAEGGKDRFLSLRPNEIAALLDNGITVCLPDVRGSGELSSSTSRGPGAMSLSANELMLGQTLTGSRLKDVRTVFRWLGGRSDIDPYNIVLWGDSFTAPNSSDFEFFQSPGQQAGPVQQLQAEPLGPLLAILTGLYEENVTAVAGIGGLVSFFSALEDNFCQIPQDVIVPGLLEVADIKDMIGVISPRPVYLAGLVTGLNKKASPGMMTNEYGANMPNLTLTDDKDQSFVPWIINEGLK